MSTFAHKFAVLLICLLQIVAGHWLVITMKERHSIAGRLSYFFL